MYTTFIFSFTELSTAIPHAGGPFAYARRAFGPTGGFIAGFATLVEFVFAPPAISLAIGAYLNVQFPGINPKYFALGAYIIFIALNWIGVGIAAAFELFVTILAIAELLVFMGVVAPGWSMANFCSPMAGRAAMCSMARRFPASSRRFRSRSGSSSRSKALRWPPKKPKTRRKPSRSPMSRAFSRWSCWHSAS